MTILAAIAAFLASWITPSLATLAAGGGLAALLGGVFSPGGKIKTTLTLIGVGIVVVAAIAFTVHYQHLVRDRAAYRVLSAATASLERRYACGDRPDHERGLAACLTARERDDARAQAAEIVRQRDLAVQEQAARDRAEAAARAEQDAIDKAIDELALTGDGPVPEVLLQSWKRARAARGLK